MNFLDEILDAVYYLFSQKISFFWLFSSVFVLLLLFSLILLIAGSIRCKREKRRICAFYKTLSGSCGDLFGEQSDKNSIKAPESVRGALIKAKAFNVPPLAFVSEELRFKGVTALRRGAKCIFFLTTVIIVFLLVLSAADYNKYYSSGKIFSAALLIFSEGVVLSALCALVASCGFKSLKTAFDKLIASADEKFQYSAPELCYQTADESTAVPQTREKSMQKENLTKSTDYSFVVPNDENAFDIRTVNKDGSFCESDAEDALIAHKTPAPAIEPALEDVVARVDRIVSYGSTIDEMKEVAALLREERIKPENRTVSRKRQLDNAFSKLLKAVNRATVK